ncbi:MAG: hypothetical protein U0T84_12580 [Chitinophagales bacterium]
MKNWLVLLLLALGGSAFAQNEKCIITVRMHNGDALSGIADISTVTFKTSYGELAFPVREVAQITLGVNTNGIDKKEVFDLADRIQNYTLSDAAIAFDKLIKMDAGAAAVLREYLQSPSYKKRDGDLTVDLAYEVLLSRNNLKRSFSTKDILQTTGATSIEGNYNFESITLESDYGRISVARSKIQSMQVVFRDVNSTNSGTFKLQANQHISGNTNSGWLNTGILVKQGQNIKINASGVVNLASISNNAYTPDGGVNGSPGAKGSDLLYGCLVMKVGENGVPVKVGDNYMGHASGTGIIYLAIYESVFNAANTGSYAAKVVVE